MNLPEEQTQLDDACRNKFGDLAKACGRGELDEAAEWQSPDGLYAKMILTDQIPRNAFRGTPEAFAYDGIALGCVKKIYADCLYKEYEVGHFWFLFQPPGHSEDPVD